MIIAGIEIVIRLNTTAKVRGAAANQDSRAHDHQHVTFVFKPDEKERHEAAQLPEDEQGPDVVAESHGRASRP